MEIENLSFFIFGFGISNQAAADKIIELGGRVTIDDDNAARIPEKYNKLSWHKALFSEYDYLILSPGIPFLSSKAHPIVAKAKEANIKIICDIELFFLLNPGAKYVAVSGTNGKSTTSSLIYHILKHKYENVYLGGNIGTAVFNLPISQDAYYVFELSSFQLDLLEKAEFDYTVLLNITPDHLDRYESYEQYAKHKYRLLKCEHIKQNHGFIFPDKCHFDLYKNLVSKRTIIHQLNDDLGKDSLLSKVPKEVLLQVGHRQNLMAALALVKEMGLKEDEISKTLISFRALEHRCELFAKSGDIQIFNDSKATNAESTKTAMECLENIYWLAGGKAKEGGVVSLNLYAKKIKKAYLFGEAKDLFAKQIDGHILWKKFENMEEAFLAALNDARESCVNANILLSPSAASFDQFENYISRGKKFKEMVLRKIESDAASK